jgi:hypothetical protein
MKSRAIKAAAVATVMLIALLGSAYANAMALHGTSRARPSLTGATAASGSRVQLKASPNSIATAKPNVAHKFATSSSGGTGEVDYTIPAVANGNYLVSFTANFFPEGSPSAPETFGCALITNTALISQDTSSSTYTAGFYVGVNGVTVVHNPTAAGLFVACGTADSTAWDFGTNPLSVTLTRIDGLVLGSLSPEPNKQKGAGAASTR